MPPIKHYLDLTGHTPLVPLNTLFDVDWVEVYAKCEFFNPSFSIKDRIVRYIIDRAEATGELNPGGTIVENTSGNTGAAAAMIAAIRGYQAILTMPDKVSQEKQKLLREYGAEVIICPTDVAPDHPDHYVRKAQSIMAEMDNAFRINQYDNLLNREAHYATTGPEIWDQMDGRIDWFVAAGSTGGTVSGVGQYLKEQDPSVRVFMPDPVGSIYYPYFMHGEYDEEDIGQYSVEGVGEDHMAGCMDFDIIDDMCQFTDKQAFSWMKKCARAEGILPGTSCGGNLHGVSELIKRLGDGQGPDTDHPIRIVTVLPDTGLKYVSKF